MNKLHFFPITKIFLILLVSSSSVVHAIEDQAINLPSMSSDILFSMVFDNEHATNQSFARQLATANKLTQVNKNLNASFNNRIFTRKLSKLANQCLETLEELAPEKSALANRIRQEQMNKITALLAAGANPNQCNKKNGLAARSVLYRAVCLEDLDLVKALLNKGAHPELGDKAETIHPLHAAISSCAWEIADELIEAGARVNHPITVVDAEHADPRYTIEGNRYLHYFSNRFDQLEYLLKHGANPLLKNEAGRNALQEHLYNAQRAAIKPNNDIIRLLTEYEKKWRDIRSKNLNLIA